MNFQEAAKEIEMEYVATVIFGVLCNAFVVGLWYNEKSSAEKRKLPKWVRITAVILCLIPYSAVFILAGFAAVFLSMLPFIAILGTLVLFVDLVRGE